jgi:hypothetical protein
VSCQNNRAEARRLELANLDAGFSQHGSELTRSSDDRTFRVAKEGCLGFEPEQRLYLSCSGFALKSGRCNPPPPLELNQYQASSSAR